jgi:hypothetical protein
MLALPFRERIILNTLRVAESGERGHFARCGQHTAGHVSLTTRGSKLRSE